jgi:hypothetical protein
MQQKGDTSPKQFNQVFFSSTQSSQKLLEALQFTVLEFSAFLDKTDLVSVPYGVQVTLSDLAQLERQASPCMDKPSISGVN